MKNLLTIALIGLAVCAQAKQYQSLDAAHPIAFDGKQAAFADQKFALNEHAFFVDGNLSDEEVAAHRYVFNDFGKAMAQIADGTDDAPMTLYLAPGVYWIDNPDDTAMRRGHNDAPYGMVVRCNHLALVGLTDNPENVVLACNRGQAQGAVGNFTMFRFEGDDIRARNLTFGNYCNVDLHFPLRPALGRKRRSSTITQAQLAYCTGDRIFAENVRFISRLNLLPLAAGKRALYVGCYFESTDDSLSPAGVYLNCRFTFFSPKPFGHTAATGAVFLNCNATVLSKKAQYITKSNGAMAIVNTRFHAAQPNVYLGWVEVPDEAWIHYQANVTLNGKPALLNADKPWLTVDMADKPVCDAYFFVHRGDTVYNVYGLLRGTDEWDPLHQRETVREAERAQGRSYTSVPTFLKVLPQDGNIESGVSNIRLAASIKRFGNIACREKVFWSIDATGAPFAKLTGITDSTCTVEGINELDETQTVVVRAATASGLLSAAVLRVAPKTQPAPTFITAPVIERRGLDTLSVRYELALGYRADKSLITWYRCTDAKGGNPTPVAVSRHGVPEKSYLLTKGDAGFYIMAKVHPRHVCSAIGEARAAIFPIKKAERKKLREYLCTDFHAMPVARNPNIRAGFWTMDTHHPKEKFLVEWMPDTTTSGWTYGYGSDGSSAVQGLMQVARGARMLYTPCEKSYGNMRLRLLVTPAKTAGQGFGSPTGQYLDIFIKYDPQTETGYGLRIVRTTKYDHAVDFILMRYDGGIASEISAPVSATCYRGSCLLTLRAEGYTLSAHAETDRQDILNNALPNTADLQAPIAPNAYGGTGFQHTGTAGRSGVSLLRELTVEYN